MPSETDLPPAHTSSLGPDMIQFSLVKVVHRVLRGKYVLLATTVLGLIIAYILAATEKPWYWAQAVFLPPKYSDFATSSPASSILLGAGDASDAYLGLLASRTIQDDVVDHLGLLSVYHTNSPGFARFKLATDSNFGVGRNSLIFVNVRSEDPMLAANIANEYLAALYRLNGTMVDSSSSHRAEFFKGQLDDARNNLMKAELDLKIAQQKTGVLQPASEAAAGLGASTQLQAQIGADESRLAGLLVGETDQAPEVVQARAQLRQLRAQLAEQLAGGSGTQRGLATTGEMPALSLEIAQKERGVRLSESGYESLLAEYGRARLASIDPGPQLEIVDKAIVPEFKSGPNRKQMMQYGGVIGLLAGLLYLMFFEPLRTLILRSVRAVQAKG